MFFITCQGIGQISIVDLEQPLADKVEISNALTSNSLDRLNYENNDLFKLNSSVMKIEKFNPDDLPMFCKMEHQMWSTSKINVRIRLGSLEYVDKLEGKY